jgi:hypothetical protein
MHAWRADAAQQTADFAPSRLAAASGSGRGGSAAAETGASQGAGPGGAGTLFAAGQGGVGAQGLGGARASAAAGTAARGPGGGTEPSAAVPALALPPPPQLLQRLPGAPPSLLGEPALGGAVQARVPSGTSGSSAWDDVKL